jgi:hypothetical protein
MKTTILGVASIVAAVSSALVSFLESGYADYGTLTAAVIAGIGLIKAADATKKR